MADILHLIDAASPQASPTTLALLATAIRELSDHRHEVWLLGGDRLVRDAAAAGVPNAKRLTVPGGRAVPGYAAAMRGLRGRRFDLIHCWSLGTLWLSAMLRHPWPRVLSLTVLPETRNLRRLAWLLKRSSTPTHITVFHDDQCQALITAGIGEELTHVVPPAIDAAMIDMNRREPLRESWGIDDDADQATCVIALLSDPPLAANALWASLGVGLAHESLSSIKRAAPSIMLLAHPAQHRRLQARKMMNNYGLARLLAQEPNLDAPWQVLPGCDAAISLDPCGSGLALRWAAAAGLPIIAENQPGLPTWLEEDRNILIAPPRQIKRDAHHLHQVTLNAGLRVRLGEAAKSAAAQHCGSTRYAHQMRCLYQELCEAPRTWIPMHEPEFVS